MAKLMCVTLIFVTLIFLMGIIVYIIIDTSRKARAYKSSAYYRESQKSYSTICHDAGSLGEYLIYDTLKIYEGDNVRFLFNVYVPRGNGQTTEIDVLMICKAGILVFESKYYNGWIFADENRKEWVQTLRDGRGGCCKNHFYNPIMQNKTHIKYLRALVGNHIPMKSIIVFSDKCQFKALKLTSGDVKVVHNRELRYIINDFLFNTFEEKLSDQEIVNLYQFLYKYTQKNEIDKVRHAYYVYNVKKQDERVNKCPLCGGDLVLRSSSRGEYKGRRFYGCSNHPKCKYIQNVDGNASN